MNVLNTLLYKLRYDNILPETDNSIANLLIDLDTLKCVYFWLCYSDIHSKMPITKSKINSIIIKSLKLDDFLIYNTYKKWLDDNSIKAMESLWLGDLSDDVNILQKGIWLLDFAEISDSKILKYLKKAVDLYKHKRTKENLDLILKLFSGVNKQLANDASKLLLDGTATVKHLLLLRSDVEDKYTIEGLKALSKLSTQKDLQEVSLDFNKLSVLGPKSRLDAMKQLFGVAQKFKSRGWKLPFKTIPTKEDVDKFLFPCSLKYNEEVLKITKEFNDLIQHSNPNIGVQPSTAKRR